MSQTAVPPSAGDGTEEDPYQIASLNQLYWLSKNSDQWDKHFIQTVNIDASDTEVWDDGAGFSPIGNGTINFTGSYNGQEYTISRLFINRMEENIGLFGYIYRSTLFNIGLTNIKIVGRKNVGGLVGFSNASSEINNCFTTGSVSGNGSVGGIAGMINNYSKVSDSYSNCSVTYAGGHPWGDIFGGLVGYNYDSYTTNSFSTGSVNGNSNIGGLVGYNFGTTRDCYATGRVEGDNNVGGLIGFNRMGFVRSSYSTGFVKGNSETGGLIGHQYLGEAVNSFWNTTTSGRTTSAGGAGKNTTQMKSLSTFTDAGWDFQLIWGMHNTINNGYPHIYYQSPVPRTKAISISGISISSAKMHFELAYSGNPLPHQYGVCWNTTGNPTVLDNIVEEGAADTTGIYMSEITGLTKNTLYYARAFFINANETVYSDELSFVTLPVDPVLPLGDGSEENPYQIEILENLYWIVADNTNWDKHYIQTANIDAIQTQDFIGGWIPIGSSYKFSFRGTYDGQGHVIDNLYIDRESTDYVGLFGYALEARISHLGLTNSRITGNNYVGGFVGYNYLSNISNSFGSGFLTGNKYVGSFAGENYWSSNISNCHSSMSVSGNELVGGLVGRNYYYAKVNTSYSIGIVNGNLSVGGLVGSNSYYATVSNSFWDIQTSGVSYSSGGTGKTTAEMKTRSTYPNSFWNFNNVWKMDGIRNFGYPFLQWQAFPPVIAIDSDEISNSSAIINYYIDGAVDLYGVCWNTTGSPTIDDNNIQEGSSDSEGTYFSEFSGLSENTVYYIRAYISYQSGTIYSNELIIRTTNFPGKGTTENPYEISNLEQLEWISNNPQSWISHFIQMDDINASGTENFDDGAGWRPIGNTEVRFSGSYNGQHHIIDNLYIDRAADNYIGLFGLTDQAEISNLGLTNTNISGHQFVGSLAGYIDNYSYIDQCFSTGSVTGVSNCVGGIMGYSDKNSYVSQSFSSVNVSGSYFTGGLAGYIINTVIYQSYSVGSVNGDNGLVGYSYSSQVLDSFWDMETSGKTTSDGGAGKTTEEMKTQSTFTSEGWDFQNIWGIIDTIFDGYPHLYWQSPVPRINTLSVSDVTTSSAIIRFELTYSGNPDPHQIGVCWNTSGDPTVLDDKTEEGPAESTGVYSSVMSGLSKEILYYVRAYAINDVDTTYGEVLSFTTFPIDPIIPEGTGTEENPFEISSFNNLFWISQNSETWDKHFIQTTDIDAGQTNLFDGGWTPIGNSVMYFTGSYNGQGHIINNLYIDQVSKDYIGLFGLAYQATIINLGLTNLDIVGRNYVGGLVGLSFSTIYSCFTTGNISGSLYLGGLLGYNISSVSNCYSSVNVSGNMVVGGLVGYHEQSSVTNCYSKGSVIGNWNAGGLVGINGSVVSNSFWDTQTSGLSTSQGGTGKTTSAMKTLSTFTNAGWDFPDVWKIDEISNNPDNDGYPFLEWQVSFNTTKKELTIGGTFTVNNKNYDGTSNAVIDQNNLTLNGVLGDDDVTLVNVVVMFASAEAGEEIIVNVTSAELDGEDSDNYTLSLNGAPTTTANISSTTNLNEARLENLKIYPNPFADHILLENAYNVYRVIFTNISGKIVSELDINGDSMISTEFLNTGIYLITIEFKNGKKQVIKMLKQ